MDINGLDPVRPPLGLTGFLPGGEPDHQLDGVAVDGQRAIERGCEGDARWPAGFLR
jgi:hypothetical protein